MSVDIEQEDIALIAENIKHVAQEFSGKTILISGGAGFLGNYFLAVFDYLNKHVLEKPCRVISMDNMVTGVKYRIEQGPQFKAIEANIKDPLEVDEDIDYILHAAGIASPKFYRKFKIETIDVATLGTRNMLELAKKKKVKSFLYFSSSEVYGDPDPKFVPTPETYWGNVSCTGPRSNYDESKRLGEAYCVAYYEEHGVPFKTIRPFNVYGPGMRKDDFRVIPNFTKLMLEGEPLSVYGSGNQTRTFCYITDAITGFLLALLSDANGEAFNIGTDQEEISVYHLAHTMVELFNYEKGVKSGKGINDAYSQGDPNRRCPDLTKAKTMLKYEPKVDLKTGLQRFVTWAKTAY